jgi:hypothetical protein
LERRLMRWELADEALPAAALPRKNLKMPGATILCCSSVIFSA